MSKWSETITVISVVGRFLEHSRVFYFENNGEPQVYLGSADVMERNFDRRVEVVTPVESPELIDHLRHTVLAAYLRDTVNARRLGEDGNWTPVTPKKGEDPFDVQLWLLEQYRSLTVIGPRTG